MQASRRLFLKGLIGGTVLAAPAIVSSSSLMKIFVPKQEIIMPNLSFNRSGLTLLGGEHRKAAIRSLGETEMTSLGYASRAQFSEKFIQELLDATNPYHITLRQRIYSRH